MKARDLTDQHAGHLITWHQNDTYLNAAIVGGVLILLAAVYALFIGDDRMIDGIRRACSEGKS